MSGAGIGAGVGLLGGALAGSPLTGALVGGAPGRRCRRADIAGQVDLGRPAWR